MTAFVKTLFGDWGTVAVVSVVVTAEVLLVINGEAALAQFAIPWLVLAGTGRWLRVSSDRDRRKSWSAL